MVDESLAHYSITTKIGEGGMGEVYRAHDTRLGRDVALKFLPESWAADEERLVRFEREARLLASLNHPNIAAIHGFEHVGEKRFLVLELVEGEDLAKRLARGPMSVSEALPILQQIAEALAAAHEEGIVHRDLKPANVVMAPSGDAKVLDFGLAKVWEGEPSDQELSNSPTIMAKSPTTAGVILGTAAYMSPEQARGRPVDQRTDVWAFGCLLWEMLTGNQLFMGETVSDTLAAVLRAEPEWHKLPPGLPEPLERLLKRCLDKDPKRRLHHMADARIEIEDAIASPASAVDTVVKPVRVGGRRRFATGLVVGAAVASLAFTAYIQTRDVTRQASTPAHEEYKLTQLTSSAGIETHPNLSPDGKSLLYTGDARGNYDVYLLRVGGTKPLNLTLDHDGNDFEAAFSPDGERIAFCSDRDGGGIYIMGATGEAPRRVSPDGFNPSWSNDGRSLLYTTEYVGNPYGRSTTAQIWQVDIATGEREMLYEGDAIGARYSPSGERIAFWSAEKGQRDIRTVTANGEDATWVTNDGETDWSPFWSPDGRALFFSSDRSGFPNLWKIGVDETTGLATGEPQAVTVGTSVVRYASTSASGDRIAYTSFDFSGTVYRVSLDPKTYRPNAEPVAILSTPNPYYHFHLSPDAEWLSYRTSLPQEDIYVVRTDGTGMRQLTDDPHRDRGPRWSPSGDLIAFYSNRSGKYQLWGVRPDGTGLRQLTNHPTRDFDAAVWSSDGSRLASSGGMTDPRGFIGEFPEEGQFFEPTVYFDAVEDAGEFAPAAWSPDERRIAGTTFHATGPSKLVIFDFETKKYTRVYRPDGSWIDASFRSLTWIDGSRHLGFHDPVGDQICIYDVELNTVETAFEMDLGIGNAVLSDDGSLLIYGVFRPRADIWMLEQEGEVD